MSQYWTDFSEYSIGGFPSDWDSIGTNTPNWAVESDTMYEGGQGLHYLGSGSSRDSLYWEDTAGTEVEVVALTKTTGGYPAYNGEYGATIRTQSSETTLYNGGFVDTSAGEAIKSDIDNNSTSLASGSESASGDVWYWMRFRVNQSDLKLRIWQKGNSEPSTWDLTATDSNITSSGYAGFSPAYDVIEVNTYVDVFGVGTNGDTAPMTKPANVPAAPTNLSATL